MALKLCKGGSQITFSDDVRCCVPSCGATRDGNRSLPFYTFPSNDTLCKEWVDEIQLPIKDLQNLHRTHMVCSKHFTLFKGGMRLNVRSSTNQKPDNTEFNQKTNSTGTQTYNDHWLRNLKESGVEIVCDKYTQCRLCASCSVQMLSIYNKRNQNLKLETLINKLLPIQVSPKDSKPLTICVQCILKLEQFDDLFNRCSQNDKSFECSGVNVSETHQSVICEAQKKHILTNNNNNCDQIVPHNIIDENLAMGANKLKLLYNNAKPSDFIKMESRKHKIKILIADKHYINGHVVPISNQTSSNNNKIIEVEFKANYIICHGKEWVYEIHVDKKQLEYTQETIDQILQVIKVTMKKQCAETNSKLIPLPMSPLSLERCVSRFANNMRTESVIIDAKKQVNDEIKKKAAEMLLKKEPLKRCWICKKCGLKLETKQSFIKHIRFNHPRPCKYCGEHITPRDQLCLHEKEHRKPTTDGFICHLCGRQFKTLKSLNIHYSQHKNRERFCCTMCNLEFTNGFGLRKHLRQHHKELLVKKNPEDVQSKRQKCNKCNLWLSSRLALRVHSKTHLPIEERMKTCPKCNKAFINARRFRMHVETHGPCPIKCPECPRSFPNQEHLVNHLQCHKLTEPVFCDICKHHFKTKTTLKNHVARVHQGVQYVQKTFTCVYCKIVFGNKDELKNHTNTHTFEEKAKAFAGDEYGKVQCNVCKKCFLFKSRLTMHKIYYHSNQCQQCGKFITDNLVSHYCKPRGSRALQYCCQYCTRRFSSKQRLNLHERTHGLDYRYHCTVCNKWFTKMSALKTHSYSHSTEKNYTCVVCGKIFNVIGEMNKHLKLHIQQEADNECDDLNPDNVQSAITLPITGALSFARAAQVSTLLMPSTETVTNNDLNYIIGDLPAHGTNVPAELHLQQDTMELRHIYIDQDSSTKNS